MSYADMSANKYLWGIFRNHFDYRSKLLFHHLQEEMKKFTYKMLPILFQFNNLTFFQKKKKKRGKTIQIKNIHVN